MEEIKKNRKNIITRINLNVKTRGLRHMRLRHLKPTILLYVHRQRLCVRSRTELE